MVFMENTLANIEKAFQKLLKGKSEAGKLQDFLLKQSIQSLFSEDEKKKIIITDEPQKLFRLCLNRFDWFDGSILEELQDFCSEESEGADEAEDEFFYLLCLYIKDPAKIRGTETHDKFLWGVDLKLKGLLKKPESWEKFHYLCEGLLEKSVEFVPIVDEEANDIDSLCTNCSEEARLPFQLLTGDNYGCYEKKSPDLPHDDKPSLNDDNGFLITPKFVSTPCEQVPELIIDKQEPAVHPVPTISYRDTVANGYCSETLQLIPAR